MIVIKMDQNIKYIFNTCLYLININFNMKFCNGEASF